MCVEPNRGWAKLFALSFLLLAPVGPSLAAALPGSTAPSNAVGRVGPPPRTGTTDACISPAQCDDGNACTADDCIVGNCDHTPVTDGTLCTDGDACTTGDACVAGACVPTTGNPISWENCRTGNPSSEWDISGAGDASIQGFATDISANKGATVSFNINTNATDYRLDIYRMGYYGGLGARKIATVQPLVSLPQSQPACLTAAPDPGHAGTPALLDCGNWAVSATWVVPATATSGIYFAKLVREDPEDGRASHVAFVVRDDSRRSDILFQTSDTTWQAYNLWGPGGLVSGNSLYGGPGGNAFKISYNRPFGTRLSPIEDWVFNAEYPMVRWLERNGYDVSYFTGVDTDRLGAEILEHAVFLSVGHDEYWSRAMRENVRAARDAGVHLAFFSGNEIYWKIRWENSIDGSGTPYRTLVCYKEGTLGELACGGKCDPLTNVWTGLWRDGCDFPAADGCEPENSLSGQISWDGSTSSIQVPSTYAPMRFWRNTAVSGRTLPYGTLGYEWDFQQYFDHYPAGVVRLSSTTQGAKTHQLSLYRHASGALVFGAGTVQWSWGLDGSHDRGSSTPDADMQQATVNLFADMGVQPATLQSGLVPAAASSDTTVPASIIISPADGASVSGLVTITGTASDAGGGVVGGVEVSTDGGATWRRANGFTNWSYDWTATQTGAAMLKSRAVDDSGNLEAPGAGVNVTVTARTCPCTIWSDATTPVNSAVTDNQPIELGVKFRVSRDGYITALRFYKGALNTGTHTANLWSAAGVNLASQPYTVETASGWQEVTLAAPVPVTANTTYVASYFSSSGYYAYDGAYFTNALDNPPLRALANNEDGPNGVYVYSLTSAFPTSTYNASNYWVDVVFSDTATDTTPPTVTSKSPAPSATNVAVGTTVRATFSEPVQGGTINFRLRDSSSALVPATVSYDAPTRTSTLTPDAPLAFTTVYTATVSGAMDLAGNAMAGPQTWSFTTGGPPPDEGPGGPILVIASSAAPIGRFLAEILKAEGFNEFTATDISNLTPGLLSAHEVAILASMPLTAGAVTTLSNWVNAGGKLIAIRPDKQLAGLLGLTDQAATLSDGYLLADITQAPGTGVVGQTIQFHGTADLYALNGARAVATLYSDGNTSTTSPAVSLRAAGTHGGWAAAFTYDLPWSIATTRQGNPAWAGDERDGVTPIRSDDMFYGNKAGDPKTDWVNLDKVAIPQADEQQRLLANLILDVSDRPLPRFWYFPSGKKAVVLMTADEHGGGSGARSRFNSFLAQDSPGCVVDDWQCIRSSGYLYANGNLTDAEAVTFTSQGFEVGTHVNTGCANFTESSLRANYNSDLATFAGYYPSLSRQDSERTHCIAWSDWSSQPKIKEEEGIRLDVNYYYWPPAWIGTRYAGMFTGSGMPMRFVALDGSMFDVYQAVTQMTDESGQPYPATINALLDRAVGPEGYYGVFTANIHSDGGDNGTTDSIVDSAQARGVPVVSGRQMLRWLDGRNASAFTSQTWDGTTLGFSITVGTGARNIQAMLPATFGGARLTSLNRGGSPVPFTTETIKGIDYAFFAAAAGSYQAAFVPDTTPPVISGVGATAYGDGTALVTWTTDEPADSRVDYGTAPGSLTLNASNAALVASHAITLTGLAPSTTYHYRVTSVDAAANSATDPDPVPPDPPRTFRTPAPICFTDDSAADFAAGTRDANAYVSETADGEVILAPTEGSEFSGSTLPGGWTSTPWTTGGTSSVAAGRVAVDGSLLRTDALYAAGRSLEFRATFATDEKQHAGFGTDLNSTPWAIFSTKTGGSLWARTNGEETALSVTLGVPHTFRIDWASGEVQYRIDGALVATHAVTISVTMRPVVSDWNTGAGAVVVDWMRMTPYRSPAGYTSRVFGDGAYRTWGAMAWTADVPAGTALAMSVRTGNTLTPDGSWTGWTPITFSGWTIGGSSYYLQYRADLSTTDPAATPVLQDVSISCETIPDTTPPTVAGRSPTGGAEGVSPSTQVVATFSEPMKPASITASTFRLRAAGATSDVAATVSTAGATATLVPSAPLDVATSYTVTIAGSVADLAGNPLGADDTWTFSTTATVCFTDTTAADFGGGATGAATYIGLASNGEVLLKPVEGQEFSDSSLPPGWSWQAWAGGGTANVGSGVLTVDGADAATTATYGPGRSLEFAATFRPVHFQHVGFVTDLAFNAPWAIFSTYSSGDGLYVRTSNGVNTKLEDAAWLGQPHRYRIDWNGVSFVFWVDGVQRATIPFTVASNMRPLASDSDVGGPALTVDWLHMSPYPSTGAFESRVLDAGKLTTWQNLTPAATSPTGTTYTIETRTATTLPPGGSWSAFEPLTGSAIASPAGRYIQYRATLTTADAFLTPTVESMTACGQACVVLAANDATCDGVDDDCDGAVDEDAFVCECLTAASCDDGNACNVETCTVGHTCDFASFSCSLSGRITYYRDSTDPEGVEDASDKGVPGVVVAMIGDASGSVSTAADVGTYVLPAGGDETVAPQPTAGMFAKPGFGYANGVSSLDAAWIARNSVNLKPLTSWQTLAGDVSDSGRVTSYDAALVAQLVVGSITRFPAASHRNSEWAFVPAARLVRVQDVNLPGVDFAAILFGDVTGNWGEADGGFRAATGDEDPAGYRWLAAQAAAAAGRVATPASTKATVYVASGPMRLPDGRIEVVLGIRGSDGILAMDLALVSDAAAVHDVSVERAGLSSGMALTQNAVPDRHAISLYGVAPMQGAGPFLKVTFRAEGKSIGAPFSLSAEANEGQIPVVVEPALVRPKAGR